MAQNPSQQILVTVCAVVRNDADIIDGFVDALSSVLEANFAFYEVLLVDNYSADRTPDLIRAKQAGTPNVRLVRLSRIYSSETALTAALDNSIGDFVIVLEPRYDSVSLVPQLVEHAQSGYDIVVVRQDSERRYSLLDRVVGGAAYKVAGRIIGQPITLQESRYRCYSRRAVNAIAQIRNKRRYLKYINSMIGFSQSYIEAPPDLETPPKPVERLETVSLIIDMIVSYSGSPLRGTSLLALSASLLSLLYLGYIFFVTIARDDLVEGWLTTNIVMTVMFFMLFLVLAVLSEYVARILDETKDEPLYFIESESSSTVAPYTRLKQRADSINIVGEE